MDFKNIENDTHCDCLNGTFENIADTFIKKIRSSTLSEKDFLSNWERGKGKDCDPEDCERVCLLKGISINLLNPQSESSVLDKYRVTFNISPGRPKHICKFRFMQNAGKIGFNPSGSDRYHYTFYKSDEFTIKKINLIEISLLE